MSSIPDKVLGLPEPDMVDKFGAKWRLDRAASDYASRPDNRGVTLGAEVWLVEELNGDQSFVLVANQKVIFECHGLAAMGAHIDRIKKGAK